MCHYHHTFSDSKMTWRCPLSEKQKLVQVAAHCYCWFAGQHSEHYKDTKQKYFCVLVVFSSEQTGSLLVFADGAVIFSRLFPLLSVFTPEAGDHSGVCSCCDLWPHYHCRLLTLTPENYYKAKRKQISLQWIFIEQLTFSCPHVDIHTHRDTAACVSKPHRV